MSNKLVRPPIEETCAHYIPKDMRGKRSFWNLPERDDPSYSRPVEIDDDSGGSWLWIYAAGGFSGIAATLLTIGATATAKVDQVFGTDIGPALERIHVNKDDGDIERFLKEPLHELGAQAVKREVEK